MRRKIYLPSRMWMCIPLSFAPSPSVLSSFRGSTKPRTSLPLPPDTFYRFYQRYLLLPSFSLPRRAPPPYVRLIAESIWEISVNCSSTSRRRKRLARVSRCYTECLEIIAFDFSKIFRCVKPVFSLFSLGESKERRLPIFFIYSRYVKQNFFIYLYVIEESAFCRDCSAA